MARTEAYFVADEETKTKVLAWQEEDMQYHKRLRDIVLAAVAPAPGGFATSGFVSEQFAEAAMALKEPRLEDALGLQRSYDLIPTKGGFYTVADIRAQNLGEDIVLTVSCDAKGRPCYALPENCVEISASELIEKRNAAWEASASPMKKFLWRAYEYVCNP